MNLTDQVFNRYVNALYAGEENPEIIKSTMAFFSGLFEGDDTKGLIALACWIKRAGRVNKCEKLRDHSDYLVSQIIRLERCSYNRDLTLLEADVWNQLTEGQ